MFRIGFGRRFHAVCLLGMAVVWAVAIGGLLDVQPAAAQTATGTGGSSDVNTNLSTTTSTSTTNVTNTDISNVTSGVAVDAEGVLRRTMVADPTGALARQRVAEALSRLDVDVARRSPLRKVSLTRLDRVIKERLATGQGLDDTMLHLAGLTRLEYVFCYPETGDIVIAGPAEAWGIDPSGRERGVETGRPVLLLQDLAVALRAFPPGAQSTPLIYCSIDPTQEGLARFNQVLRQIGRYIRPGQESEIVQQLQASQGMHEITVGGVPATTHFAQVLVEADYRMKLIGIGLEQPPVRLASYVARANPAQISRNALQRWFFVPDYQCVRVSDDANAMQLVGEGVRLVGENEVVSSQGTRSASGRSGNRASDAFVREFTKVYPKLAERSPVFAELRNCIDMAVAAAFIQHQDYYGLVDWNAGTLRDEKAVSVETENAPKQVEAAINAMWKGSTLLTPIGGGVQMRPSEAIAPTNLLDDEQGAVGEARAEVDLSHLAPDQWWWD